MKYWNELTNVENELIKLDTIVSLVRSLNYAIESGVEIVDVKNCLWKIEEEIDFLDDPENYERAYYGRMSPFVKENIFREYQKGYTIKDLSLKYGILQ